MAKNKPVITRISDTQPKNSSGNYQRLFGDADIGGLISQVQSAAIKAGYVLETIISEHAQLIPNDNLDDFIGDALNNFQQGVFLCTKELFKNSSYYIQGHEPDLIVFDIDNGGHGRCYIIELKVGSAFDTKKSDAEKDTLDVCRSTLGAKLPFITNSYLCAFHAQTRQEIVTGLKGRFTKDEVLTGKELCEILHLKYEDILQAESTFQSDNITYFTQKVVSNAKNKLYPIYEEEFYSEED